MRKTVSILIISLFSVTLLAGCGHGQKEHDEDDITILRYENVLFETPSQQLQTALLDFEQQYQSPLLNIFPDNPQFMTQLQGFINDSTIKEIYGITKQKYESLFWLENSLTKALKTAHSLYSDIEMDHFATFVSGFFDYSQRILVDKESKSVLISIDQYAIGDMEKYSYFGLPMFIVERCDSIFLASDIMAEIARQYIVIPDENSLTMLDMMITEGKVLYFLDQVMPQTPDNIKIRYSKEQLEWMQRNEGRVWAYFIQNNLLYEKDYNRYHNFVDEAPKTNAFKDSAPRTTEYIGWQIVRGYMENNKVSLKELFENSNSQSILQASRYKPQ